MATSMGLLRPPVPTEPEMVGAQPMPARSTAVIIRIRYTRMGSLKDSGRSRFQKMKSPIASGPVLLTPKIIIGETRTMLLPDGASYSSVT